MTTQEERFSSLEREQIKIGKAIRDLQRQLQAPPDEAMRDIHHNLTILIGLTSTQEWNVREMKNTLLSVDDRLTSFERDVYSHFETQDKKLDQIDQKFSQVDHRFDRVDQKFSQIDQRFDQVDQRFNQMDQKFDRVLQVLATLVDKIK